MKQKLALIFGLGDHIPGGIDPVLLDFKTDIINVQEYGSECKLPNTRFINSVNFFEPHEYRRIHNL